MKENAKLKLVLQKLKLAHDSDKTAPKGDIKEREREQTLCSPCAAYLLKLQEKASAEHVRNQGRYKSEAHGREKIKEGKMQETSSRQGKIAQGINETGNDD